MPEVVAKIESPADPYVMLWSIPTYELAGAADVMGLHSSEW